MIAINIADLTELQMKMPDVVFNMLIDGYFSENPKVVRIKQDMFDGDAIVVDGPNAGDPERLAAFISTLQTCARRVHKNRGIRVYERKRF